MAGIAKKGRLGKSVIHLVTSERGDRLAKMQSVVFQKGCGLDDVIHVYPDRQKQKIVGIGTSCTEASAFVLAHLDTEIRAKVMNNIFSKAGANFSMMRIPIGACDFCVDGRYSYDDINGDTALAHFSIGVDADGFSKNQYPGIKVPEFDLLPMIKQAIQIKELQRDKDLRIVASAWTAPAWMKDIDDWYQPGSPQNDFKGTGGCLKNEYVDVYARYLVKYLQSYENEGVPVWGITPVNEPMGNNGQWESMHFTPASQNAFVKDHLGPALHDSGFKDTRLFVFDHNRTELEEWADTIFSDQESARYVSGAAVHWYESSIHVGEDILERVHKKFPQFSIIHSEGCIDDLGKDAPPGIMDPERFKESDWFGNDEFWWNENATDWAYSATWPGVKSEDHPIYTPVHRYARNIIESFNHWLTGWIDWNIVLDSRGGPNHVGNYCGAPIMVNLDDAEVYYTPIFYVLAQLSQTMRPDDRIVSYKLSLPNIDEQQINTCASLSPDNLLTVQILNTGKNAEKIAVQIGDQSASLDLIANALHTIQVQL